jgi:hypothetical protein
MWPAWLAASGYCRTRAQPRACLSAMRKGSRNSDGKSATFELSGDVDSDGQWSAYADDLAALALDIIRRQLPTHPCGAEMDDQTMRHRFRMA